MRVGMMGGKTERRVEWAIPPLDDRPGFGFHLEVGEESLGNSWSPKEVWSGCLGCAEAGLERGEPGGGQGGKRSWIAVVKMEGEGCV